MSIPTALFSVYLVLGLLFAFFVVLSDRKKRNGLGPSAGLPYIDPYTFWLYLLLWPATALLWLANYAAEKKKEGRRNSDVINEKDKSA